MVNLLSCPFCSSSPDISGIDMGDLSFQYLVECFKCQVSTASYPNRKKAIQRWNTRIKEKSDWIRVEDNLPNEFEEVLFSYVIKNRKINRVCGHIENGVWHICYLYHSLPINQEVNVTHWMKLPENPR